MYSRNVLQDTNSNTFKITYHEYTCKKQKHD
jgi:hypothetical protein